MSDVEHILSLMRDVSAGKEAVWISAKILDQPECKKETAETIVQEAIKFLMLVDKIYDATEVMVLDEDFSDSALRFADEARELGSNLQTAAIQKVLALESVTDNPEILQRRLH